MRLVSINDLKKDKSFVQGIRWDVTPKIFMDPSSAPRSESGKLIDVTYGYMLYVDLVTKKPVLVIMQLRQNMSQTIGYIAGIPGELLKESMHCSGSDCIAGMYPISGKLEDWLKKEFGLS
ncbi:MAG: hypothetical protein HY757_01085 [Nitrospirae bacterium]|nr:hypothetical protein [Nitrospirota bacterium]